ncbi:unnamed protein product [Timema podura]|uniref:VASt domain-containing protein n=1 Tax=Timema podura TaxID=61482 RepID=A0ABN7NIT5_TIMPD|nr:unnamed protein product [Timema podura]
MRYCRVSNNIDCVQEFTESPLELPVECHLDDSLPGLLYRHQQVSPHSPGKRVPGIGSINLISENLPSDMSDTTDSDADKHGGKGEAVVCSFPARRSENRQINFPCSHRPVIHSSVHQFQVLPGLPHHQEDIRRYRKGKKWNQHNLAVTVKRRTQFTLYIAATGQRDMNLSPWQQSPDSGLKQRVVTLTMPLSQSVGPKSTHVCETQVYLENSATVSRGGNTRTTRLGGRMVKGATVAVDQTADYGEIWAQSQSGLLRIMLPCSKPGQLYAIDSDSVNSGIPYADSFYVTTHYCITRTGDNECCLAVYCQIKYKKNVWGIVKSFIEKNTWSGLEDFHTSLTKALQVECDNGTGLGVKKKVRRRRRGLAGITPAEAARPIIGLVEGDGRTLSEMLSWGVMAILVFLVCLNALLYYKLWVLEEWTQNSSHSFTVMDLQVLRFSGTFLDRDGATGSQVHSLTVMELQVLRFSGTFLHRDGSTGSQVHSLTLMELQVLRTPPKSQDEWLRLLQQQEALHNVEMQKWQKVLQAAVQLLRQTEESLSELQVSIHPLVSKKVLSVLKDTFAEEAAAAAIKVELPAEDVVMTETSREEL